ncbi:MAG: SlyX family protein [Sulfuricellaceae bacterium]|nr:SlyX family protein [Sulfuricellaceae bacterium]
MPENRLIEIESKLTLQEDLLQDLNHVIYTQQKRIDRLESLFEALIGRVSDLSDTLAERGVVNERPPHY